MARPPVNPGVVTWAGDHLILALRTADATADTTFVSYYRTHYSPAGGGQTALILSQRGDDTKEVHAIYTDNPDLTTWVRANLIRRPQHSFRDTTLPVILARFETTGAVGQTHVTTMHAPERTVVVTWADFETPFYLEAPMGVLGADYDIFSLICPAQIGTVEIDGRQVDGQPYSNDIWARSTGQSRSSALVAICEVLIERPDLT